MEKVTYQAYLALTIGVLAVSTAAILVKLANSAPASIIANYRLLIAALIMAPYILIYKKNELKLIAKRDWVLSTIAGVFLAFHFIFWFESLNYTSVASSVVLVTLQPIFAFIGTYIFFQERFTTSSIISMVIAILGSVIISWGDFQISGIAFLGDVLAVIGAIMVTSYFLVGQNVRKRLSLMTYTFVVYSISCITLTLYNIILQKPFTGFPLNDWLIFIALAVIPTFFGHTLFNWSLKWLSTSTISMGILFEPIGATILAYYILGEHITGSQLLGGSIVIFGLSLFIFTTSKKKRTKKVG